MELLVDARENRSEGMRTNFSVTDKESRKIVSCAVAFAKGLKGGELLRLCRETVVFGANIVI